MTAAPLQRLSPHLSPSVDTSGPPGSRWGLLCLLLALLWAPVPLGSNRPWALALLALLLWLGLLGAAVPALLSVRRRAVPAGLSGSVPLLALALGLFGWVALQAALGAPQGGPWPVEDAFAARHFLLRSAAYLGAMLLCLWVVTTPGRARWVMGAVLLSGLLQALLAVALHAGGAEYQFFFHSFDQGHRATGTFVNPDHFAGYMELTLSAGLGLMLAMLGQGEAQRSRRWQERVQAAAAFVMSTKMLLRLSLVVMVIALVLTRSRMGNGAFVLSMLFVGVLVAVVSARLRRPALWLVASMVIIDLVVIGQWVGLDKVAQRMKGTAEASSKVVATFGLEGEVPPSQDESLAQRMEVPHASLALVAQRPVVGWGGGSFGLVFPGVKPPGIYGGWWDQAHNDYVQMAAETGLVGAALWISLGLLTAWRAWPLLKDRQTSLNRGIGVAALMALCCIGLHSWVDFNLQIPANALTMSVLLSLVWVAPCLPTEPLRHKGSRRNDSPRSRPANSPLDDD